MDIKVIWTRAQKEIADKVSSVSFDLWIKPLVAEEFTDGEFILSATSTNMKSFATNEKHFPLIEKYIKETAPIVEKVTIIDAVEKEKREQSSAPNHDVKKVVKGIPVNPTKTFSNFVVGKSNEVVAAACEMVAKNPGKKINPLFIHGRSGLGKTHLLNAIANHILNKDSGKTVLLTTCADFTNDYIETLKNKEAKLSAFRERYRNVDVLLIDDIQFLAGKPSTQEEFFHTFNDLHQNGRQVVITSDRHADQIETLEERMRSRFKSGLIQDIQSPDTEMRIAILQKKAALENHRLEEEIINYLATHAYEKNMNIRDMEGALFKVIFYAQLKNREKPSLEDCHAAFNEEVEDKTTQTTAEAIIECVCKYFNVSKENIVGKKRNREFVEPRMFAIYLITEFLNIPLVNIGQILGGRDHTTVLHARNKIATQKNEDQRTKRVIADISAMIEDKRA